MLHSPRTSSPWPAPLSLNIDGLAPRLTDTGLPPTPPLEFDHIPGDFTILEAPLIHADDVPVVAVVGVGYVGTHLVDVFASHYDTIGFDISRARVDQVRKEFAANPRASFTSDPADLAAATHFLISVPTLLLADKSIDSSYLRSAIQTVAAHARPGATIVIESSVAVGMTREVLGPVAMAMGFFAGMSPEVRSPFSSQSVCVLTSACSALIPAAPNRQHTRSPRSSRAWTTCAPGLWTASCACTRAHSTAWSPCPAPRWPR